MAIRHNFAMTLALLVCSTSIAYAPALAEQPLDLPAGVQNEPPITESGEYRPTEAQKLTSCMDLWEPETHMSKTLWKTVCKRIQTKN